MFAEGESRVGVAFLIGGAALLVLGTAAAQQDSGSTVDAFTTAEVRQLAAGELVQRRASRRRGQQSLIGGNSWQVIDQPVDVTWRAICDTSAYRQMLPATEEAEVVSHHPGRRVVHIRHAVGLIHAEYYLQMSYDHERRDVTFRLDRQRPHDLRAAWGFLNVRPYEDDADRSLLSYGVMVDPGGGMFGGVLRGQIHDWLLRVPETTRQYLQGSGAHRY